MGLGVGRVPLKELSFCAWHNFIQLHRNIYSVLQLLHLSRKFEFLKLTISGPIENIFHPQVWTLIVSTPSRSLSSSMLTYTAESGQEGILKTIFWIIPIDYCIEKLYFGSYNLYFGSYYNLISFNFFRSLAICWLLALVPTGPLWFDIIIYI